MSLHKEISFESEICQHLSGNGWLYADGDAAGYQHEGIAVCVGWRGLARGFCI